MDQPPMIYTTQKQPGFWSKVAVNVTTALIVMSILGIISWIFGD